jgi:hypothetical protein
MTDIAALQLQADSKGIRDATVALREIGPAATAAEKAAQRWGMANDVAGRSAEDFSRRVQGTIKSLEFEQKQLTRTAAEQAKYTALRRAGVSAASAEGQAIAAAVAALQAQRVAIKGAGEATTLKGKATAAAGSAASALVGHLRILAAAYISVEAARGLWETGLKAGDLGEQAEQIGINTDQLQAYRLAGAQAGIETEAMDGALTKLQKAMGSAADGNKEMIERFQQLGVKLLDARGELRPVADVLPEVAKGVLGIGSSSQRTATLMDLFGKSGAKMATVLEQFAQGNDSVIASARKENAIISPEAIAAWDTLGDRMIVTKQRWATLIGEFGAKYALPAIEGLNDLLATTKQELQGIASIWKWIISNMDASKTASILSSALPAAADRKNLQDRLDALRQNPTQFGFKSSEKALTDQLAAMDAAAQRAQAIASQAEMQHQEDIARRGSGPPISAPPLGVNIPGPPSVGAGNPAAKATGSDPYKKAIESAKEYTALKNAETAAVGENVLVAARLKHEQELVNKASEDANKLSPAQIANLKGLAVAMAEADSKFATAKFMDDAITKSNEFIAAQEIERDTLYMSEQAADAYRIAQGYLNDAKSKGIELTAEEIAKLQELANAQAASAQKTRDAKAIYDLAKDTFKGFLGDLRQGIMDGKSFWESFGNAAMNALDKIASKLLEMAADKIFEAAFGGAPGTSGAGGGFLSSLFSGLFSGGGGATSGASVGGGLVTVGGIVNANGNAFNHGNVIPFARGGVVGSPTMFPMAGGRRGLMGEAGPEAVMPLQRGPGGRLGVAVHGGGQPAGGTITVHVVLDSDMLHAQIDNQSNANIVSASPKIVSRAVKESTRRAPAAVDARQATSGGDYRRAG